MNFKDYSAIKNLIDEYWILNDAGKYDEFIAKLTEILRI